MLIHDLSVLDDSFMEGYRGVLLLHRNKDGEIGNAQRNALKRISSNSKEWLWHIHEFDQLRRTDPFYTDHRIYSSVNARNMDKSIRLFKERQLEADYDKNENHFGFYQDIENRFFSCFMNPKTALTSYFIIDCDLEEARVDALKFLPEGQLILDYPTKNGRHLLTHPFNPTLLANSKAEIKKDALLYIG